MDGQAVDPDTGSPQKTSSASYERCRKATGRLRTLQRRLKERWGIMAKELVYAGTAAASTPPSGLPEMALAGADPRC